jgi:hypothetical protein
MENSRQGYVVSFKIIREACNSGTQNYLALNGQKINMMWDEMLQHVTQHLPLTYARDVGASYPTSPPKHLLYFRHIKNQSTRHSNIKAKIIPTFISPFLPQI